MQLISYSYRPYAALEADKSITFVGAESPEGFAMSLTRNQKQQYGTQFDGEQEEDSTPGIVG